MKKTKLFLILLIISVTGFTQSRLIAKKDSGLTYVTPYDLSQVGGGTPAPSTQILYGGITRDTSSGDFIYDVSGELFKVSFSGSPWLMIDVSGNLSLLGNSNNLLAQFVIDNTANTIFAYSNSFQAGDVAASVNNTYLNINDASQLLTYQKGVNKYLSLDIANGVYGIGDLDASLNSTKAVFDDVLKTITLTVPSDGFINLAGFGSGTHTGTPTYAAVFDASGNIIEGALSGGISIGSAISGGTANRVLFEDSGNTLAESAGFIFDVTPAAFTGFWGDPATGNSTSISWSDAAGLVEINSFASNFLRIDVLNGASTFGAVDGGTFGKWDNNNALITMQNGTNVFLSLNVGNGECGIGDLSGFGNNTKGIFDDAAQTITLNANNGIIFNNTARLKNYTVATLPAGTMGDIAIATDLLLPAFFTIAAGSGAVVGPVYFDGTNWRSF